MLEWLIQIDTQLMYFFNVSLANPVFDFIMPIITHEWFVRSFLLSLALIALIFGGKYGRVTFVLLILAVIFTDQISSQLIKPAVGRLRPCKVHEWVHLLVNCSSGKSFPSSHAANSFGQAAIWVWRYPKYKWFFIVAAILISYSRIACGVHYPFDVIVGAAVGTSCAIIVILFVKLLKELKFRREKRLTMPDNYL